MAPEAIIGARRAVIAATDDSQERRRFRVRVYGIHSEDLPVTHLPWAECCFLGGGGWGDYPYFENGDRVIVIAEQGDREHWFIIGGWITSPKGQPDLPPELTGDYASDISRWVRVDRAGNLVELSSKSDELRVRLKSGNASVVISQLDDSIEILAEGPVSIRSNKASIVSEIADINAGLINIESAPLDGTTEQGAVNIFSNKDMTIFAGVGTVAPSQDGKGYLLVGQYKDGNSVPRQTDKIEMLPNILNLGKEATTPPLTPDGFLHTTEINLEATTKVSIKSSGGTVQVDANDVVVNAANNANITVGADATVDVTGALTATVGGDATLDVTGAIVANCADLTVSPTGTVNLDANGAVNITAKADSKFEVTGKLNLTATGDVTVQSTTKAVINGATSVELGAGALGNIVTTLHACAFTGAPHPFGSSICKAVF